MSDCGTDALGTVLEDGDQLVCMCCGSVAFAYTIVDGYQDDGFDYPGSTWVLRSTIVREFMPARGVAS